MEGVKKKVLYQSKYGKYCTFTPSAQAGGVIDFDSLLTVKIQGVVSVNGYIMPILCQSPS